MRTIRHPHKRVARVTTDTDSMKSGKSVMYEGSRWLITAELDSDCVYLINNEKTILVDKSDCQLIN